MKAYSNITADKFDIFMWGLVIGVIFTLVTSSLLGFKSQGQWEYKAVQAGVADYITVDLKTGTTKFHWRTNQQPKQVKGIRKVE